eukprot:1926561-Prorocentrum_lima.AAC.1
MLLTNEQLGKMPFQDNKKHVPHQPRSTSAAKEGGPSIIGAPSFAAEVDRVMVARGSPPHKKDSY